MIKNNIIMLVISIVVILFLMILGVTFAINNDLMYLIPVGALLVYLIFTTKTLINEYKVYIADEIDGVREGILQFRSLHLERTVRVGNNDQPGVLIGQFKVVELASKDTHGILGKWISLSGDFRDISLVKNKRYIARFFVNSRQLVSIELEKP